MWRVVDHARTKKRPLQTGASSLILYRYERRFAMLNEGLLGHQTHIIKLTGQAITLARSRLHD